MEDVMKGTRSLALNLFLVFLKRQGVRDSFKKTFECLNSRSFLSYLYTTDPEDFITCAFDWSLSPEGLRCWSKLNSKWNQVLKLFKF